MAITAKKRIWGWMSFDWAAQPFYTLGLTFIFGPYFAVVAANYFMGTGLAPDAANAEAQSTWAFGQTIAGLAIAFTAPFLGAFADNTGRRMPWIAMFSAIFVIIHGALVCDIHDPLFHVDQRRPRRSRQSTAHVKSLE